MYFFRNISKSIPGIILILSFLLYPGCSGFNIFPPSKDISIGKNLDKEIRNDPYNYPMLQNPAVTKYVQNIVNEIIKSPIIEYRNQFVYSVEVIDNDDVINAFCVPGGYIYVYTGLLKFVDNEATLAAVLAHEIAHAERRHATSRMSKAYGIQFLYDLIKGDNKSKYADMAKNLFTGLGLLQNSREDEYEADKYSFKYLQSTKWYPGAINNFFEKIYGLAEASKKTSDLDKLLSTHPLSRDRITKVTDMLKQANMPPPTEKNLFYRDYQAFKIKYGF